MLRALLSCHNRSTAGGMRMKDAWPPELVFSAGRTEMSRAPHHLAQVVASMLGSRYVGAVLAVYLYVHPCKSAPQRLKEGARRFLPLASDRGRADCTATLAASPTCCHAQENNAAHLLGVQSDAQRVRQPAALTRLGALSPFICQRFAQATPLAHGGRHVHCPPLATCGLMRRFAPGCKAPGQVLTGAWQYLSW